MKFFEQKFEQGITLVETIVLISIYTVLLLAITMSITNLYKMNSYSFAQADEVDSARRGVIQWSQDTREMTTAEDGTFPIVVIDEHHFGYYSDVDQDDPIEYVEYILSGTTLTKYTYDPSGSPAVYNLVTPNKTEILSTYVQNINQTIPTFLYFDNAGTQLNVSSPLIDVRYIRIQIIVNIDPVHSPGEFMLRSSIAPRNLKDNL